MRAKDVLIFVGGATVGSLVTWFVTKKYYEKKADKVINDAIAAVNKVPESVLVEVPKTVDEAIDICESQGYTTLEYPKKTDRPSWKQPAICDISLWEENNGYNKVELIYYAEDDTVSTAEDVMVSDVLYMLGDNYAEGFDEAGYKYVFNENNGTVYEVMKSDKSYEEVVTGRVDYGYDTLEEEEDY